MLALTVSTPDFAKAINALAVDTQQKVRLSLESVGLEVVAYLKSTTSERRPPVRKGGPLRFGHPGHWADDIGQLVNSYAAPRVTAVTGGARLTIENTAEYASYLELREGFFVVSGIMDRNGPVAKALRDLLPKIDPSITVDISQLQFQGRA